MPTKKKTFEAALQELEKLTEQIERGEIGLEESITRYEQGMKLIRFCRDLLTSAEQRIEKLSLATDAQPQVTDADVGSPNRTTTDDD